MFSLDAVCTIGRHHLSTFTKHVTRWLAVCVHVSNKLRYDQLVEPAARCVHQSTNLRPNATSVESRNALNSLVFFRGKRWTSAHTLTHSTAAFDSLTTGTSSADSDGTRRLNQPQRGGGRPQMGQREAARRRLLEGHGRKATHRCRAGDLNAGY